VSVEQRLRRAAAPDMVGARDRARRVVLAAAPASAAVPRRRWPAAVVAAVLVGAFAVTPPGDALARFLRDLIQGDHHPRAVQVAPRLGRLPDGGWIVAAGPGGAFALADGGRRRLGDYDDAVWSPHGRFIAVIRGSALRAIDPVGHERWTLTATGPVADPRWSSTGYRIAYRRDDDLRVVAGDGSGDHPLVDSVAPVPAAWRQGPANQVAVARTNYRVQLWSADTGELTWSLRAGNVRDLAWSPAGRLVVTRAHAVWVLDGSSGSIIAGWHLARPVDAAALSPDGRRVALASGSRVSVLWLTSSSNRPRARLDAAGPVTALVWSPQTQSLLAATATQWLFLPGDGGAVHAAAVDDLRPGGWCCAEDSPIHAPFFADAPDLYLRTSTARPGACSSARVSWASTVPFRNDPRAVWPIATVHALGPGDALVTVRSGSGCGSASTAWHTERWPGMRRTVRTRTVDRGTYTAEITVATRDAAGRARARQLVRSIRWPHDLG
jgi:hypothetical protein